jgi:hypothetical protein
MKRVVLVLAILAMVFGVIPARKADAYAYTKIGHLSTEHRIEVEFSYFQSGITFLVRTKDGQVIERWRTLVGNFAWLDLPDEEVEISFYEPIWWSESLWQDGNADGWFSWTGGRLKAFTTCRDEGGKTPHILILGENLGGETWMLGSGDGMNDWFLMYNNGGGGIWPYGYGTYQGFVTNIKTNVSRAMIPGETLYFTVYTGDYTRIFYGYLASVVVVVPDCKITPTPTSTSVPATPTATVMQEPTSTAIPPTATPTATPVPTETPIPTATPTATPIIIAPSVPSTSTPTVSSTPVPTYHYHLFLPFVARQ